MTTTPEQRVEQAGHAEAVATLDAMRCAIHQHQQGKGPHPSLLLCELLCQIANMNADVGLNVEKREHFIAGVSAGLYPWLALALTLERGAL